VATRLVSVVIDSADPATLGRWWADALGWTMSYEDRHETDVAPAAGEPGIDLTFVPVDDERVVKNRVHLDLRSTDPADQAELVERLRAAGARPVDIGRQDVPWVVLADPEGNEFCVLEPRPEYARTGPVAAVVLDCVDAESLVPFWQAASGWEPAGPTWPTSLVAPGGAGPWLDLVTTGEPHRVKNRVHLDVAPFAEDDQGEDVARLLARGALRIDVGQSRAADGDVTWVVLTDPEQNEFCVLSSRA
jgi:predicted enzyme related to lactoylglutathione lyase